MRTVGAVGETVPYDLTAAADAITALLPGVADDDLDARTPCPEYAVRDLLFHLIGLSVAFRDAARKALGPTTGKPPGTVATDLPEQWRTILPARLTDLAEAWRDPAAWQGTTQAGGVDLPGAAAGQVALNELTVHGWDLARATGQPYQPAEESLRGSYDLMLPTAASGGMFGPPVAVPDEAPPLDRVVGLSGRDPAWPARV